MEESDPSSVEKLGPDSWELKQATPQQQRVETEEEDKKDAILKLKDSH